MSITYDSLSRVGRTEGSWGVSDEPHFFDFLQLLGGFGRVFEDLVQEVLRIFFKVDLLFLCLFFLSFTVVLG